MEGRTTMARTGESEYDDDLNDDAQDQSGSEGGGLSPIESMVSATMNVVPDMVSDDDEEKAPEVNADGSAE
jgi:hypothetical protein